MRIVAGQGGEGLTMGEVTRVVNQYIGVSGGYLADFTYRTHADFYPEYCELDVDPYRYMERAIPERVADETQRVIARIP